MMSDAKPGAAARPPRWMPIGGELELCPAGQWWDAIRVPEAIGRRAIVILREADEPIGPVIFDHGGLEPRLYFLVAPGATARWKVPGTVGLGKSCHVVVPPAKRTSPPGLHWHHLSSARRALTRADSLRDAIHQARKEQQIL